jgi:Mrp family chromosome partitioning ATPase
MVMAIHMAKKVQSDTFDTQKVSENLKNVKHTIIVMSGKGGVGKSTVAANLAFYLSWSGRNVGLLDADIHGPTIPKLFGIEQERPVMSSGNKMLPIDVPPHLKVVSMGFLLSSQDAPVIWRGPVKMGAIRQFLEEVEWGELDYLIIDLPPGTGDEPLTIAQLLPKADGIIIVTTPQDVALLSVRKSINFASVLNIPILGMIENMAGFSCPHCNKEIELFRRGAAEKAASDFKVQMLGSVPIDPKIAADADKGMPFVLSENGSASANAFREIVDKLKSQFDKKDV